jgi:hypothetical protein
MPLEGLVLVAHALRRLFPYLQGVLALLVVASWTRVKTVGARDLLPKFSHDGERTGGLPSPLLPLLPVARAQVWGRSPRRTDPQSGTDRGCADSGLLSNQTSEESDEPC